MLILGIESSCDECAAAVVRDGRQILSNIIASQVELHARWSGVVPELAFTLDGASHQAVGVLGDRHTHTLQGE